MKKNILVVRSQQDAEEQLKALYKKAPVRAGSNRTHVYWYVGKHRAEMARTSTHRDGNGQPMFMVEVK